MTIEQKCEKIIETCNKIRHDAAEAVYLRILPMDEWVWNGHSLSYVCIRIEELGKVIKEIDKGDEAECLTSSNEFIRECKRHLKESSAKETHRFIEKKALEVERIMSSWSV